MLERLREGVAKAKAEGKYKGRAPTARAKAPEVRQLHKEGVDCEAAADQQGERVSGPWSLEFSLAASALPDGLHDREDIGVSIPLSSGQNVANIARPDEY